MTVQLRANAALHARNARQILAPALLELQSMARPGLADAITRTANASNALYRAEAESTTDEATSAGIRIAVEELTHALKLLNGLRGQWPELELPLTSLARTLALLYPIARASIRQRRDVHFEGPDAPPVSVGRRQPAEPFSGQERRSQREKRVSVDVDIGLLSHSNFYTGISLDVSNGGLFVSTYQPSPAGTEVSLYFVLPSGHSVEAEGIVRWTRAASNDCAPGMGVAFTKLKPADAAAIAEFCANRPPLYFEE